MIPVLLTIHVIIVLALVGVVLMQRSEGGGALGMGGGGGGGLMTGSGAANALTRATAILAFLFFTSSLTLAIATDRLTETEAERAERLTGQSTPTGAEDFDSENLLDVFESAQDGSEAATGTDSTNPDALVLDPEESIGDTPQNQPDGSAPPTDNENPDAGADQPQNNGDGE